jgi:hypothetical protein
VATRKGADLSPVITMLMQWGDRYAGPAGGPPRVAVHTVCGHDASPQLHCEHRGEAIGRGELTVARRRRAGAYWTLDLPSTVLGVSTTGAALDLTVSAP